MAWLEMPLIQTIQVLRPKVQLGTEFKKGNTILLSSQDVKGGTVYSDSVMNDLFRPPSRDIVVLCKTMSQTIFSDCKAMSS